MPTGSATTSFTNVQAADKMDHNGLLIDPMVGSHLFVHGFC